MSNKKTKSKAKAAGVKSTFLHGDEILMTSFGKGNEAVLEKAIKDGNVKDLNEKKVFGIKVNDDILEVESHIVSGSEISIASIDGKDGIGAKDELEKRYFGKTFPNDNIRIQLIYNILDIDKILVVYANNILYALNNLRRKPLDEEELDYVGMIFTGADYESVKNPPADQYLERYKKTKERLEAYLEEIEPYAEYFGNALCKKVKVRKGNGKAKEVARLKDEKEIYNLLRIISMIRQSVFHGETATSSKMLYNLTHESVEMQDTLKKYYSEATKEINANFIKKNSRNLQILFGIYDLKTDAEKRKLTRELFDFMIYKANLNLGFSLKKIREIILTYDEATAMKDKKYDSVRHKLYSMLDFILYKHSIDKEESDLFITNIVSKLRATRSDEEKEEIYISYAREIWKELKGIVMGKMLPDMNGRKIASIKESTYGLSEQWIDGIRPKTDATLLAEAIYVMTLFLDGKEINELVSQLINKFENINGFISVLKFLGEDCEFTENYKMLAESKSIANELRFVKSIARMQKSLLGVSVGMYRDAVSFLGLPQEDVENYVDEKFCGKDKNLRNFIINNLIESSRFQYIARYSNPEKARKIAENRNIVSFVLKRIPDSQIARYYESVKGPEKYAPIDKKAEYLADMITGMSFKKMEGVRQKVYNATPEAIEKEHKKAVLSLYLTVIYIAIKNLVNVNARYTMAISAFERDASLFNKKVYLSRDEKDKMKAAGAWVEPNYLVLADMYTERLEREKAEWAKKRDSLPEDQKSRISRAWKRISKRQHVIDYIGMNKKEFDAGIYRAYRNSVVHLNAVTNADLYINEITEVTSYYDVYQYIMQRSLSEQSSKVKNPAVIKFFEDINKYKSHSKNLTKVLNLPFVYNLPRYINLTIRELFNDKDDKQNKE